MKENITAPEEARAIVLYSNNDDNQPTVVTFIIDSKYVITIDLVKKDKMKWSYLKDVLNDGTIPRL